MEWSALTGFTGNQTYTDLTVGSVRHIANLVGVTHLAFVSKANRILGCAVARSVVFFVLKVTHDSIS